MKRKFVDLELKGLMVDRDKMYGLSKHFKVICYFFGNFQRWDYEGQLFAKPVEVVIEEVQPVDNAIVGKWG